MPALRTPILNLLTTLGSIFFILGLFEIVLRFLPVAVALPVQPPTDDNPIQRYRANTPFTWSLAWNMTHVVRGHSNAQGFLADYDYDPADTKPLVAVVGDSFIEALRVPFAASLTGRLQAALGARGRAYAFAQSGAPLSQYVAYAQHACATYHPERLVVSVVGNDFDESIFAHRKRNGFFHLYPKPDGSFDYRLTPLPAPGPFESVARHSALALYLMRNVGVSDLIARMGISPARAEDVQAPYVGQTDVLPTAANLDEGDRVIDWFLDILPKAACLPSDHIVITMDAPRPNLYDPAQLTAVQTSYFVQMRNRMITQATKRGFRVIDTQPVFIAAYAADLQPFEYPTDGHWNEHGHKIVADAVIKALGDWGPLNKDSRL